MEWGHNLIAASWEGNIECLNEIIAQLYICGDIRKGYIDESIQKVLNRSLLLASEKGHTAIVDSLLSVGANVKYYELVTVCSQGRIERANEIITKLEGQQEDIKNLEVLNRSLLAAARKGHTDIVKCLLEVGSDANSYDSYLDVNALFAATIGGHYETVETLLMAKADVNFARKVDRSTALTMTGDPKLIRLLLAYGADVNHTCNIGTALDINHTCTTGTALAHATERGESENVKILLEAGAEPDKIFSSIYITPLTMALRHHYADIIKSLLQYNANVNHVNGNGFTPLDEALHGSTKDPLPSTKLLIQYGVDVRKIPERTIRMAIGHHMMPQRLHGTVAHNNCEQDNSCIVGFLYAAGAQITEPGYNMYKDRMPQFIKDDHEPSLELNHLCRRKIREYLLSPAGGDQSNLYIGVSKLPLPGKLRRYLLFDIEI